jgi:hypothetical protein
MITPPDETYSTAEAASILRVSERQCARYLAKGLISARRPNGHWLVTAVALWKYLGIEDEMMRVWLDYCGRSPIGGSDRDSEDSDTPDVNSMT